jgi:hypothetical protein
VTSKLQTPDEIKRERFNRLKAGLPHLYERRWYQWAKEFYGSRNKMTLLCAANQISKSSTQIRKCIEWAGNPELWPELWGDKGPPRQFWYLYPDKNTATAEFEHKWKPEFLPRGDYKKHPTYGWTAVYGDRKRIDSIIFNSGVTVYFKTYEQDVHNLQSGTVFAIFCDEELEEKTYSELQARLIATDGYFSMVFTATKNQDFWRRAMEGEGDAELFPDAMKIQVSMYDCLTYTDGSPGAFTEERIEAIKRKCKSETEVQRRVYGKFVTEVGRKYASFDASRHYKKPFPVPGDWHRYVAVDKGSGGQGHSPAIAFVAVRPDQRYGVIYKGWKGDDGATYTSGDVFSKFVAMRGADICVLQKYDQGDKDFHEIAERNGETFMPSDKSHERGEDIVNTLFKNDMLFIFDTEELQKLGAELTSLMRSTAKRHANDDFADAMRYAVVDIPWDWSALQDAPTLEELKAEAIKPYTDEERVAMEISERRGEFTDARQAPKDDWQELENEFAEWNEAYGN